MEMQFDLLETIWVLCRLLAVTYQNVVHSGKYLLYQVYIKIELNKFYGMVRGGDVEGAKCSISPQLLIAFQT